MAHKYVGTVESNDPVPHLGENQSLGPWHSLPNASEIKNEISLKLRNKRTPVLWSWITEEGPRYREKK